MSERNRWGLPQIPNKKDKKGAEGIDSNTSRSTAGLPQMNTGGRMQNAFNRGHL